MLTIIFSHGVGITTVLWHYAERLHTLQLHVRRRATLEVRFDEHRVSLREEVAIDLRAMQACRGAFMLYLGDHFAVFVDLNISLHHLASLLRWTTIEKSFDAALVVGLQRADAHLVIGDVARLQLAAVLMSPRGIEVLCYLRSAF